MLLITIIATTKDRTFNYRHGLNFHGYFNEIFEVENLSLRFQRDYKGASGGNIYLTGITDFEQTIESPLVCLWKGLSLQRKQLELTIGAGAPF